MSDDPLTESRVPSHTVVLTRRSEDDYRARLMLDSTRWVWLDTLPTGTDIDHDLWIEVDGKRYDVSGYVHA